MIDDILEMILKEARGREGKDLILNILDVWSEIEDRTFQILDDLQKQQDIKDYSYLENP